MSDTEYYDLDSDGEIEIVEEVNIINATRRPKLVTGKHSKKTTVREIQAAGDKL